MNASTLFQQINQCNAHANITTLPNQDLHQLPTALITNPSIFCFQNQA